MKHLTEFTMQHTAIEVPVVLMGDLNAQHFGEVRGIARTVFQVSNHPCHNFLFRCADVPTGPTSMTDCRKVRIDAVMFQPKHLKVLGIHVPHLKGRIPDEIHPSDHVAVRVKFEVKADHLKMQECARAWLECVTGTSRLLPMTDREIKRAFSFLDRDSTSKITKRNLQEGIVELDMGNVLPRERQMRLLDCFPNQVITYQEFISAYEIKFNASRMGNIGDLEQAFGFFDSDNDGKITADDVYAAFSEIVPIDFTEAEVETMLAHLSDDWKEGLDIHTFCEALCKINFNCTEAGSASKPRTDVCTRTDECKLREKLAQL
jgi:Ca2+-binding EF-hand superfamily protein